MSSQIFYNKNFIFLKKVLTYVLFSAIMLGYDYSIVKNYVLLQLKSCRA